MIERDVTAAAATPARGRATATAATKRARPSRRRTPLYSGEEAAAAGDAEGEALGGEEEEEEARPRSRRRGATPTQEQQAQQAAQHAQQPAVFYPSSQQHQPFEEPDSLHPAETFARFDSGLTGSAAALSSPTALQTPQTQRILAIISPHGVPAMAPTSAPGCLDPGAAAPAVERQQQQQQQPVRVQQVQQQQHAQQQAQAQERGDGTPAVALTVRTGPHGRGRGGSAPPPAARAVRQRFKPDDGGGSSGAPVHGYPPADDPADLRWGARALRSTFIIQSPNNSQQGNILLPAGRPQLTGEQCSEMGSCCVEAEAFAGSHTNACIPPSPAVRTGRPAAHGHATSAEAELPAGALRGAAGPGVGEEGGTKGSRMPPMPPPTMCGPGHPGATAAAAAAAAAAAVAGSPMQLQQQWEAALQQYQEQAAATAEQQQQADAGGGSAAAVSGGTLPLPLHQLLAATLVHPLLSPAACAAVAAAVGMPSSPFGAGMPMFPFLPPHPAAAAMMMAPFVPAPLAAQPQAAQQAAGAAGGSMPPLPVPSAAQPAAAPPSGGGVAKQEEAP